MAAAVIGALRARVAEDVVDLTGDDDAAAAAAATAAVAAAAAAEGRPFSAAATTAAQPPWQPFQQPQQPPRHQPTTARSGPPLLHLRARSAVFTPQHSTARSTAPPPAAATAAASGPPTPRVDSLSYPRSPVRPPSTASAGSSSSVGSRSQTSNPVSADFPDRSPSRPSPFTSCSYPPPSLPASAAVVAARAASSAAAARHNTHSIRGSRLIARSRQSMYAVPAMRLADMATKAASYVTSWVTAAAPSPTVAIATATATITSAPPAQQSFRPPARRAPFTALPSTPAPGTSAAAPSASYHLPSAALAMPPEGYFHSWGETTSAAFKAAKAYHKRQMRHNNRPPHNARPHASATSEQTSATNATASATTPASSASPSSSSSSASAPIEVLPLPAKRSLQRRKPGDESSEPSDDSAQSDSSDSSFALSADERDNEERDDHAEEEEDDGGVGRGNRRDERDEVLYVSSDSEEYRASRRRSVPRRFASLSRSRSRSASASLSPSPCPSRSLSPPPHPLSSYRTCMTCLHRLSKLHFTAQQWALAKEYSQCKECDTAAEGSGRRRRRRQKDGGRTRERRSHGSSGSGDRGGGGRMNDRAVTRHVWRARKHETRYLEGEEGEVIEEVERDEIIIDDDEVREMEADQHRAGRVTSASKRAKYDDQPPSPHHKLIGKPRVKRRRSSLPAADRIDDGAQTEVDDDSQLRRRRRQRGTDKQAEMENGPTRKRRRRGDDGEACKGKKKRKVRKYNLAPEINPYNRNFTAQQLTQSRTGRLGASADTNTPPPPPLQPDVLAFLRSSFGLDGVDHKSSTQVSAVYAKHMEQTGTLANGKVYVAVSGVNSLDGSVDSDEEGAASVRRTRQRQKQEIAQKGKTGSEQWQPMLGLFAGRDIEKDEVVTTYGGVLVDGDDARRRHASTYTHIRRIRDSRMVRDGRLFSALFDRSQVDMYDQFSMDGKRKSRKRLLPACGAEHVITALSMEGHEDEMRVGLILLDALQGERGALYGQGMEPKEQQAVLGRIMAHIGEQATVISGEALKQIDGKRYLSRMGGPALIINEPSATFYSSSPNPYSSRSGDTNTEGEQLFRDKSLDIAHLFPFQVRPQLLPPLLLHPLPEQRHKALRELSQNISDSARQLLAATCGKVHELLYTTGMGFMANTGSKRDCNVRVIEVNPRRDGLAPNEIFYVSSRRIAKGAEILAPYNNNESKSKRMARGKGKQKADEEDDDDDGAADGQEAEHDKDEDGTAADGDEKYAGLTGTQKARMKRREAMERKQKKRELLRIRALQRSANAKKKAAADAAEAGQDAEEVDMDEDDSKEDGERRVSTRSAASAAMRKAAEEADECDFPATDAMELLTPSSSSPSPSPCSVSPSPNPASASTSPPPSFSPVPPTALHRKPDRDADRTAAQTAAQQDADEDADAEAERERQRARERAIEWKRAREQRRREQGGGGGVAAAAAVEVIDVDSDGGDDDDAGADESQKGFSILRRQDSPWMPTVIYEQRTRARSAFGGEQRPGDVKVVVSFQQMNKQQVAHEFERMQRRDGKRRSEGRN